MLASLFVVTALSFNLPAPESMTRRQSVRGFATALGAATALQLATTPAANARNNFATSGAAAFREEPASVQPSQPSDPKAKPDKSSPPKAQRQGDPPAAKAPVSAADADLIRLGLKPMSDSDECYTSTGRAYNCRP